MNEELPIIERIELIGKEDVRIHLSDGNEINSHIDVLHILNIKKGKPIDKEIIDNVISETKKIQINKTVYNYISYKPRTKREIINKLRSKGYDIMDIDKAIQHFTEIGYINDEQFALDYAKTLERKNKYSILQITEKLMNKGIDKKIITNVIEMNSLNSNEYELAMQLAQKKIKMIKSDESKEMKAKIYRYLAQKKFSPDVIRYVLEDIFKNN